MDRDTRELAEALGFKASPRPAKLKSVEEKLKKAKDELVSLIPDSIRDEFDKKSFLGGGAIYSLYNDEEPKDYDFFVTDNELAEKLHKAFSFSYLKYRGGVKVGKYRDRCLIVTDNAISLGKYQIITRFVGTPKEVIGQFDFKHNQFYYVNGKIETLVKWRFLDDKKLRYNEDRARDICGTIIRVKKFVERGFTITNREMAKMLLKLHDVGFNERELEILNSHDEERNNFGS